jgi:thiol-disulfide isomerase/thioredoxin
MRLATTLDRRAAMLGLAGLMAGSSALAEGSASPVARGILANNKLAQSFEDAPRRELPSVTLVGPEGEFEIEALKGRAILMPLWAEWCAPCLSEMPDFARLQKKYGNDRFAILPVLTGTRKRATPEYITEILKVLHADALRPLMEKRCGNTLMRTMARKGGGTAIPCNLLIAPNGSVVAREIGRVTPDDASAGTLQQNAPIPESIIRAIYGQSQSLWGKPDGEMFVAALAAGFLD